jgi:hypothetical protein
LSAALLIYDDGRRKVMAIIKGELANLFEDAVNGNCTDKRELHTRKGRIAGALLRM